MKKRLIAWALALTLSLSLLGGASAANFYLIRDSDTRYLTENELWQWNYDALGYILNEIFARHGYNFKQGGQYDRYFQNQDWYTADPNYSTKSLNKIEWANERLVKDVRGDMRAQKTTNPSGKSISDVRDDSIDQPLDGFFGYQFKADQKLKVFTGPGENYLRAANGKASCSTNGNVYVGGTENGWLLIMYMTNGGSVRVGYVRGYKDKLKAPALQFDYANASVAQNTFLTDDPVGSFTPLAQLPAGTTVRYLSAYYGARAWAYVEYQGGERPMRGFVPLEALNLSDAGLAENENG